MDGADGPAGANDNGHGVDKHHLVEFKNFGSEWPEEKGGHKKENIKTSLDEGMGGGDLRIHYDLRRDLGNGFLIFVLPRHVDSLAEKDDKIEK